VIDPDFLVTFLEKYKITDYKLIRQAGPSVKTAKRRIIFNFEDNCYYKIIIQQHAPTDVLYFLNKAYFPNHFVSSVYDEESQIWLIKQTSAPGISLYDIIKMKENTLDKNFIIKMMEWFKWQHTESRRLFPKITNKYFMSIGSTTLGRADLSTTNIMYDVNTKQFTYIDFEMDDRRKPWGHWYSRDKYISFVFGGIIYLLHSIWENNDTFKFLSNREYPILLNYCLEYLDTEIT
tara:strand:+ start:99 stop:800 length:702 start_codon:yes stop_codon:yes gene_type:complete